MRANASGSCPIVCAQAPLATTTTIVVRTTVYAIGYGAGTIDLPTPNVIRLFLGEARAVPAVGSELETICQIETTVDDMLPQTLLPVSCVKPVERGLGEGQL